MKRIAFMLHLKENAGEAYDEAHATVWPEMLSLLKNSGVSEYSIFRRGSLLFLYMHVEDFEATWSKIEKDPINSKWQAAMGAYFAATPDLSPGERFPMMEEVFYLS